MGVSSLDSPVSSVLESEDLALIPLRLPHVVGEVWTNPNLVR